jgi:hypothetical protein
MQNYTGSASLVAKHAAFNGASRSNEFGVVKTSGMNLFVKQVTVVNAYHTQASWAHFGYPASPALFVRGTAGVECYGPRLTLAAAGFVPTSSGDMNLVIVNTHTSDTAPLSITGSSYDFSRVGDIVPLHANGSRRLVSDLPLHLAQKGVDAVMPLFVTGPVNSNTHAFIPNVMRYGDPTLFISGGGLRAAHPLRLNPSVNKTAYLYMSAGGTPCETMNLFLMGQSFTPSGDSLNLAIYGDTTSTMRGWVIGTSDNNRQMNLVITGSDSGGTSRVLNLVVTGGNPTSGGIVPLYVESTDDVFVSKTPLFIKGLGMMPGYMPIDKALNMFVARGPNAGIPLAIAGYFGSGISFGGIAIGSYAVPLTIIGSPAWSATSASSPLFIQGPGGIRNSSVNLSVRGDVFHSNTSATTLVMPGVIGFVPTSAALYTNGFNS